MIASGLLTSALAESKIPGLELAPTRLVSLVASEADPISALADMDKGNSFFSALREEIGLFDAVRTAGKDPAPTQFADLVCLLRWVNREFAAWTTAGDPSYAKLTSLFVITRSCDKDGEFWRNYPGDLGNNRELLNALRDLIARSKIELSAARITHQPISDKEALDAFRLADAQGNWAAIEQQWGDTWDYQLPEVFLAEAGQCLHRFGFHELVQAVSAIAQTPVLMMVLARLAVPARLHLALASANPHVQFVAVFKSFSHRRESEPASADAEALLAQLFAIVATDLPRWRAWMQTFNRYPPHYGVLQTALGGALAVIPEEALGSYVNSILLNTLEGPSRKAVAVCLRAFRSVAAPTRRQALWSLAYARWKDWNFGVSSSMHHLVGVGTSELDYAVVGYAIECMNEKERDDARNTIASQLSSLPDVWHASQSDLVTEAYRLLSHLQPFAFASSIGPSDDWLMENRRLLFFDPSVQRYEALLFGIRPPQATQSR